MNLIEFFGFAILYLWMPFTVFLTVCILIKDFSFPVSKIDTAFPSKEREELLKQLNERE